MRQQIIRTTIIMIAAVVLSVISAMAGSYTVVDTGQIRCYDNNSEIKYPKKGQAFFGQDAQYISNLPSYKDNGDGTITDLNTGLMWQKNPGDKKTHAQAVAGASRCRTGGYRDWRLPTIKELYSLILFSGTDPDPETRETSSLTPFIDTKYFNFTYGKSSDGDRAIDSQFATSTKYVSTTMHGNQTMFGVNFADGRIKGYPIGKIGPSRKEKKFYVLYVRGNSDYGKNDFKDNGDGTITDNATGLTWSKTDSHKGMNWKEALAWVQKKNSEKYLSHTDWRLPNAKELQSIVDYFRSPDTTHSAAIDPIFQATAIRNEGGRKDYPFYWTSTTHATAYEGNAADYISFGRALGYMKNPRTGKRELMDVHGAGAQRSDPKTGSQSQFPYGRGPQGDVIRINNYVRLVRGGDLKNRITGPSLKSTRTRPERRGESQPPEREQRGRQPSASDFIDRLDRDGDGKISISEFDGPADHFRDFDRNNDGYITKDEAPTGPPPRRN